MSEPRAVEVLAPAKVNLLLRILDRKPSGFHDLETLFQAIDLHDRLHVTRSERPGIRLEVRGADLGPADDNLVVRAARAYLELAGRDDGLDLVLEKNIPAGGGLGGGSSDAAATLLALARMFPAEIALERLQVLAGSLGSDVPFFLCGSPYGRGEGRGDQVTPLPPLAEAGVVLGLPPVHVGTGPAYGLLAASRGAAGWVPPSVLGDETPASWDEVAGVAVNDFERVVARGTPLIQAALDRIRFGDPLMAMLSGSGSAVFAVHRSYEQARKVAHHLEGARDGVRYLATRTLVRTPVPHVVA